MDSGWQPYQDPLMGRPAQLNAGLAAHPQQLPSKYGQPPQSQAPVGYTYESFQTPGKAPSAGPNSKPVSMASSPTATPRTRDYVTDADTTMEDADPYNRAKYSSRQPQHTRASSQFLSQAEESSAARRYSPMNVLSPPMSYPTSPGKSQGYGYSPSAQSRRSPARNEYASPPQGYQSPPCKFSHDSQTKRLLADHHSFNPPPTTSPASVDRSQPRPILPTVSIIAHGRCVWFRNPIPTLRLPAVADAWPRPCTEVSKDQVRAGAPAPDAYPACIPTCQPRGRLHQRE